MTHSAHSAGGQRGPSWPAWARWVEVVVVLAVLAAFVALLAPTLDAPLLDRHAFRQTQTAFAAREFREGGLDLLHPRVPVFGEPFELPFEFPLFQALATLPMALGVAEDTALRGTSLACFVLAALLLYGLVRFVAGPVAGVAALLAFTVTPLAIVWSRASMIEYLAAAGAVGFAFALVLWREERRHVFLVLALVAGLVGMLVKPTTALFWIAPALLYRPTERERRSGLLRVDPLTLAAVAVSVVGAVWWTRHADAIKAASPITEGLTSSSLRRWNHGWVRDRLDLDLWWLILERAGVLVVGLLGLLLLPAIVAGVHSRQRWFWLGVAGAAVLPPAVFMNLYVIHDYYLVAVSPALAALIGLGAGWLWSWARPGWLRAALPVALLALALGTLAVERDYWTHVRGERDEVAVLPVAAEIGRLTPPGDLVAVDGLDWLPAVLYYARRRGHMVVESTRDEALDRIHDDGYRHLFRRDPAHDDVTFFSRWKWVGARGPHMYGLADSRERLPASPLVSAAPDEAFVARLRSGMRLRHARRLQCDRPNELRSGRRGTWLLPSTPEPNARLFVANLAPVPLRGPVFVSRSLAASGTLTVLCTGVGSITLDAVVDADGPGR